MGQSKAEEAAEKEALDAENPFMQWEKNVRSEGVGDPRASELIRGILDAANSKVGWCTLTGGFHSSTSHLSFTRF